MKRVPASNGFPMIRGAVMGPIVRALDAAGADCEALLAEFGLSRRQLSDPYEIVPLGHYVGAFERAAQVLLFRSRGDPQVHGCAGVMAKRHARGPCERQRVADVELSRCARVDLAAPSGRRVQTTSLITRVSCGCMPSRERLS